MNDFNFVKLAKGDKKTRLLLEPFVYEDILDEAEYNPNIFFYGVAEKKILLGVLTLEIVGTVAHIRCIKVLDDFCRNNLGSELMYEAFNQLKKAGIEAIQVVLYEGEDIEIQRSFFRHVGLEYIDSSTGGELTLESCINHKLLGIDCKKAYNDKNVKSFKDSKSYMLNAMAEELEKKGLYHGLLRQSFSDELSFVHLKSENEIDGCVVFAVDDGDLLLQYIWVKASGNNLAFIALLQAFICEAAKSYSPDTKIYLDCINPVSESLFETLFPDRGNHFISERYGKIF